MTPNFHTVISIKSMKLRIPNSKSKGNVDWAHELAMA